MSVVEVLVLLLVAGVCGSIGQGLGGAVRGGFLVAIVLGFIGALIGVWLARELEFPAVFVISIGGKDFPIVWSIVGSALFVAVLGFLSRGARS